MTEDTVMPDGAPAKASRSTFGDTRAVVAVVLGALTLLGWVGLIAGSFLGLGEQGSQFGADVLLGLVVLAALAGVVASPKGGVFGVIAAAGFAVAWYFIGWKLLYASDAVYYLLIAAFYLAPPVVGLSAILCGRGRAARLHRT